MKLFILEDVDQLTERYHSGGALIVIANNIAEAKEVIKEDEYIKPTEDEWNKAIVYNIKDQVKPTYYTFQDAGCC